MKLCYAKGESSHVTKYKKLQRCNRCQKTGHYAYKCSALNAVPRNAENSNRRAAKRGPRRKSDAVAKTQHYGQSKMVRVSRCGAPY